MPTTQRYRKNEKKAVDGLVEMKEKTTGGKTIQLFGLPHVDLFNTGRMLIPGVDLKMRFTLNDPKFFMNGLAAVATNVRLQASDLKMKFYACMVKVRSDVYNKIATARLQKNLDVYYPTVRSEIRTYTLQNNHTNFEATDVFNGRVPDRVVVGLVYQDAFSGNYAYNPFNFPKFNVSSIKQIVEGEEYPYQPLQLIADNGQYDMSGYHRLISANCSAYRGKCMIKPEHWGDDQHTTLYMWDNVASGCADSVQLNPKQEGRVAVSEIVMNLLKNNVPVIPVTMARLRPYRQILRQIGNRAVSLKKRRQALINQKGGKLWNGLTTVVKTCCR